MSNQTILVLDFGGQYKELIARRVRECNVLSLIKPGNLPIEEIKAMAPIGIILPAVPNSVYEEGAPRCNPELFTLGIPILGICYGLQLMCYTLQGEVRPAKLREYGTIEVTVDPASALFSGLDAAQTTLMSHTDQVVGLPEGFVSIAHSQNCPTPPLPTWRANSMGCSSIPKWSIPKNGTQILRNFVYNVCGATGDYTMDDFIETQVKAIREKVGNDRILLGLSGGVDSSVCAALLSKAVPGQRFLRIRRPWADAQK